MKIKRVVIEEVQQGDIVTIFGLLDLGTDVRITTDNTRGSTPMTYTIALEDPSPDEVARVADELTTPTLG